jgi:hypothetical protein
MSQAALQPLLLDRLFDDASQFPPGNLRLEDAVEAHARWRRHPRSRLVGRFLLPVARVRALSDQDGFDPSEFELGVVVAADLPPSAAAEAARILHRVCATVSAIEVPLLAGASVVAAWRDEFPEAELFLECQPADIPQIAALGARAKLRCGGLNAEAVPAIETVSAFIAATAAFELPFKATAGLHQPLRHFDSQLGCEVHGFLNLWVATGRAMAGAPRGELAQALTVTDLASLAAFETDLRRARAMFSAFGTCSISEPIEGLVELGVLDE